MPKGQKETLGRSLQNQQRKRMQDQIARVQQVGKFVHEGAPIEEDYQIQQRNLQSIVDQDTLNEYLQLADLANQKFTAERKAEIIKDDVQIQNQRHYYHQQQQLQTQTQNKQVIINVNAIRQGNIKNNNIYDPQRNNMMKNLRIPRRPEWNVKMSVQELREKEGEAFLNWRRELAKFEEENYTIQLTPYEKNIEVWKQLWRVVEKSDILVQVVDGRDPLFYRCDDLEKYVMEPGSKPYNKEQIKQNFLLINKSDLMSDDIRIRWNSYFIENNIDHMFFSAKLEQERIDNDLDDNQIGIIEFIQQDDLDNHDTFKYVNTFNVANRKALLIELKKLVQRVRSERKQQQIQKQKHEQEQHDFQEQGDIKEQLQLIQSNDEKNKQQLDDQLDVNENLVVIGMVGYPNVGKSSVINTLCHKKLVGVGSRPGKTKHFQTIQLEKELMLCDCPGLIFPNASSSRGEMVCNGVLPIDNMKDYLSPVDVLAMRIPKIIFEKLYGINLRDEIKLESQNILQAFSKKHGYVTGRGLPDEAKAARIVLKDFVNGRLIFCKLPPNYDNSNNQIWQSNKLESLEQLLEEQNIEEQAIQDIKFKDIQFTKEALQNRVKLSNEDLMEIFTQDDLLELMEGKRIKGIKLTKAQRREIKFTYSRDEPIDLKKYLVPNQEIIQQQDKIMKGKKIEIKL